MCNYYLLIYLLKWLWIYFEVLAWNLLRWAEILSEYFQNACQ
jgi:hypothetical protein